MVEENERAAGWYSRINIGVVFAIAVQTVAAIVWITTMSSDISELKRSHIEIDRRLDQIDTGGSKAAALLQQRIESVDKSFEAIGKQQDHLTERQTENIKAINELSLMTAREIPKIQGQMDQVIARIKSIEDQLVTRSSIIDKFLAQQGTISPLQQSIIDGLRGDIARLEDRQNRTMIMLDKTYNLIDEHLRLPTEPRRAPQR